MGMGMKRGMGIGIGNGTREVGKEATEVERGE